MNFKKGFLIILDGWGIGRKDHSNAIYNASTPFMDSLLKTWPNATLRTDGEHVGLPDGQMGNSEVGHLNIGAGRIVYQELLRINRDIASGAFFKKPVLLEALQFARDNNRPVHFMGLVSDGGIHSHIAHLEALLDMARDAGLKQYFVHAFTDGRDTDPHSGIGFIQQIEEKLKGTAGKLASVVGRYYSMDRDNRWQRIMLAYDLLTKGIGRPSRDILQAVRESYDEGVSDEFLSPIIKVSDGGRPVTRIRPGDVVISFNFRTDRPRQIISALTQRDYPEFDMKKMDLYMVTMTSYDDTFRNLHIVYETETVRNGLGEYFSSLGLSQLRIAETEKYPHVTFFFSGGREEAFTGEQRIMIPSPKVSTYDLKPEMSAREVKDAVLQSIQKDMPDFICLNFANPDMVGHTGVFEAAVKAVETVDSCLSEVVPAALKQDYVMLILADHGNPDYIINEDGTPNTAHTKNPVPLIAIDSGNKWKIRDGILADVAPTLLTLMGIDIPESMTGKILVEKN